MMTLARRRAREGIRASPFAPKLPGEVYGGGPGLQGLSHQVTLTETVAFGELASYGGAELLEDAIAFGEDMTTVLGESFESETVAFSDALGIPAQGAPVEDSITFDDAAPVGAGMTAEATDGVGFGDASVVTQEAELEDGVEFTDVPIYAGLDNVRVAEDAVEFGDAPRVGVSAELLDALTFSALLESNLGTLLSDAIVYSDAVHGDITVRVTDGIGFGELASYAQPVDVAQSTHARLRTWYAHARPRR